MPRAKRKCRDCPALIAAGSSRCGACQQRAERARGTRQQRGYDVQHDRLRRQWAPQVATGTVRCGRCGQAIPGDEPWDLGHTDDRAGWTGPEHARCNRAAGGRAAH